MKLFNILVFEVILFSKCFKCSEITSIRQTEYGFIRGKLKTSEVSKNVQYFSFIGVPFAQPPIGKLRFQEPTNPKPWLGIRNTTTYVNACVQIDETSFEVIGSEDCLYLEISEPITARNGSKQLMPVFVYIHGGTFISGSSNESDPTYFMEKPVILVSLQYRLNVFGFLTTNDQYARGNVGLKDLQFALEWVQRNIRNFAGDQSRVTIGGFSAGSSAVQYLFLSPKSQKLFHGIISQSGTALNKWSLERDPLKRTIGLAKGLGISARNSSQLVLNLQNVDCRILIRESFNEASVGPFIYYNKPPFAPVLEPKSKTAFIDETTYSIYQKRNFPDIPVLMGQVLVEASFFSDYVLQEIIDLNMYNSHPKLLVPFSLNVPYNSICENVVLNLIKQQYFNNEPLINESNWVKFESQNSFIQGIIKSASFISKKSNLYYYQFSFIGTSTTNNFGETEHGDDLMYLFYSRDKISTPDEKRMQKAMVTMWSNFILTGNPTPKLDDLLQNTIWPKFNENQLYLSIDKNFTIKQHPFRNDVQFWNFIFQICGFPPYYTY